MFFVALDDIGILQSYLLAWSQTHELLLCHLLEVITLNPNLTPELHLMGSVGLVLRIVDGRESLILPLGIIGNNHLHGIKDSRHADGPTVQIVTHHTLQQCHVVQGINLRIANLIDELHDTLWRVASATETTDCRHTGIIPAADDTVFHQCLQVALRQKDIVQVQLVELCLTRTLIGGE